MGTLGAFYDLLGARPGAFAYHLVILLALEAMAGISFIEYRHTRNPDQHHVLWAFFVPFLLRIPLLAGSLLEDVIPASLLYALDVASLTSMWWAFLTPLVGRRAGRAFLVGNLLALATTITVFFSSWQQTLAAAPLFEYAASWQRPIWDLWATLIPFSAAALLLVYRGQVGHSLPTVSFTLMTLGNGLILLDQVGLGRLVNLVAYPLLAASVYRAAIQDLWAYRQELETLSGESLRQTQELLFLVEISRAIGESLDLDMILQRVVESMAHVLNADRTAIFLAEEGTNSLRLATQYAPLEACTDRHGSPLVPMNEQPLLTHVVRRRRQLILDTGNRRSQLGSLYSLLGSRQAGPVIIQPLVRQRRVLGALLVGNDRSRRSFTDREARLCSSIAAQVSAAIDNASLYQRLDRQALQLAKALETQEEVLSLRQAILESIAEGVIVTNTEGRAVLMNAAAEEILGTKRGRILGRPFLQTLKPAVAGQRVGLDRLTESGAPLQTLLGLEGKQIYANIAPVRASSGERLGLVAVLRDVTREVQAERAKQGFISTISHELRTPLTAILGYAEALYSGMVGDLTQTQANFIHIIHDNARRMVAMADNLIALSESERGRLELEYAETDLPLIIGEVVQAFVPQMKARELEWSLEIEDDFPLIEADPTRIRQVVANLVSNAVKFTFPGGHITIGAATVRESEGAEPQFCRLWVQDTGIGIPPEEQSRIWERFYRADDPLRAEAGGLGVGLTIVKSLVEAHDGRVWLDSPPGKGSTFTVLLPIRYPPSPLPEEESPYPDLETAVV